MPAINILDHIKQERRDAIEWQVEKWMITANQSAYERGTAITKIAELLQNITNEFIREQYVDNITNSLKIKKTLLITKIQEGLDKKEMDEGPDENEGYHNLPKWMDKEQVIKKGYAIVNTKSVVGYYGWSGTKVRFSNFLIKPIFHVDAGENSRHIFEIYNGHRTRTLDVPSQALVSLDILQRYLVGAGSYIFFGSKSQLLLVSEHLLMEFPSCSEIKFLGWQGYAFFAWVNRVYVPGQGYLEVDENGIVEIDKEHYLIPPASKVYKQIRSADDQFENERALTYVESPITFSEWAAKMNRVYLDKGLIGVAFIFVTCFRDVIFSIDNNCPLLYGYGETTSGKSKWAESLTAVFYVGRAAFNLNSGTDHAFFSYMQRFRHCLHHLNEFDEKDIKDAWFQSIKGIYDGEQRERGQKGSMYRTEIQKILATILLTGQYLVTKDDNSVVSRSIICAFSPRDITEEDRRAYDDLKAIEKKGLSSMLTELFQHREKVKKEYYQKFNDILGAWRKATSESYNQRILQNWCHLSTMWQIFSEVIKLPMDWVQFDRLAYAQSIKYSRFMKSSDTLSEFWNTVAFLLDEGKIISGWDFKIETLQEITLRKGDGKEHKVRFDQPKKLLFIRLNNVHKHYEQAYRLRKGETAMSFENLSHYFSNRDYFVGQVKQKQFRRFITDVVETVSADSSGNSKKNAHSELRATTTNTNAYVFDYDLLNCDLERTTENDENFPVNGQQEIF